VGGGGAAGYHRRRKKGNGARFFSPAVFLSLFAYYFLLTNRAKGPRRNPFDILRNPGQGGGLAHSGMQAIH